MTVPLGGGTPSVLYTPALSSPAYTGPVVNGTHVYFYDYNAILNTGGFSGDTSYDPGLVEFSTSGGGSTVLAPIDFGVESMTADANNVYWATASSGDPGAPTDIMRLPVPGGTPVLVAATRSGLGPVDNMAVDTTSVYWTTASGGGVEGTADGTVMKAPIGGGPAVTLASIKAGPYGIAVDATSVYWISGAGAGSGEGVFKLPLNGGTPIALASGQSGSRGIAVDATSVYWTNSDGTVMKTAK
jgi:hypothetical protein